jgi:peroxiredoxin
VPPLNQPSPDFELPGPDGICHRLSDYLGRIIVINFWSCECPHSERTDRLLLATFLRWEDEVVLLTVASNANEEPQALEEAARTRKLPMLLLDPDHAAADLYEAQATPHAFVIDQEGILRYQGAVDDVAFRQRTTSRLFVEEAVEALLARKLPEIQEHPAFGCAIVRDF